MRGTRRIGKPGPFFRSRGWRGYERVYAWRSGRVRGKSWKVRR